MAGYRDRLFFDIETSPCVGYFWKPGYKLSISYENIIQESAIICICYKWEGDDKVHRLTWRNGCDKAMLERFVKVADSAVEIIAHNGDKFDLPWIRTRCVHHRIPMFPEYSTVDTLKKSRGQFRFNSNRLDYIASYLGFGGKKDTGGFGLWKDVMSGDRSALSTMVDYCEHDVRLLEKVYAEVEGYFRHKTHMGVQHGGYRHHCPRCGAEHTMKNGGHRVTAAGTIRQRMICVPCGKTWQMSEREYAASVYREHKDKELSEMAKGKKK